MHRHNDVEINLVLRGQLRYVFAGKPLVVREGQVAIFWAAQPHGLVDSTAGEACWVHVPLSTVMGWALPENELSALLRPRPIMTDAQLVRERLDSMVALWLQEIPDRRTESIAVLEIQAAVRRILGAGMDPATSLTPFDTAAAQRSVADEPSAVHRLDPLAPSARTAASGDYVRSHPPEHIDHTMAMAQFVVDSFRSDITAADVADAAHLTPSHAMTVFRRTVGVTIGEYVTMCRVAEAQRLLITTSMTTADVAAGSGFGSLSSFYHHVTAACGMPPRQYRLHTQER